MSGNRFVLHIEGIEHDLEVVSFRGREALSTPFRFDVQFLSRRGVELKDVLARRAQLELSVGGKPRVIVGIVGRFTRGAVLADGIAQPSLRLVPQLFRLSTRRASRIFQDQTTPQIVARVLGEHRVALLSELKDEYRRREYCVQHEETDLAFLTRLLAEDGIVYRFDPPPEDDAASSERLVLFDKVASYADLPGGKALAYRPAPAGGSAMMRDENHVTHFEERTQRAPGAVLLTAFDFEHPERDPRASSPEDATPQSEGIGLELIHEHHGPYPETQVVPQSPAMVLEQLRRSAAQYRAESSCARLSAGHRVELGDHDDAALSGGYAVTRVDHRGVTEGTGDGATYENSFRAVHESFLLRPARPTRVVRQSLETATVTGPAKEEIHTDRYGRIRVHFHWDVLGKPDDTSSCWIRVAQTWAGAGFGGQFIPRVGMEVLVAYLGGDPDRPIVVGSLPDATHPPAFPLPANKTRSGWRSRSTPDSSKAGHNEISFEDAAGAERVILAAHRDLDISAHNDFNATVSNDHNVQVAGSSNLVVQGGQSTTIIGHGSTSYGAGGSLTVRGSLAEEIAGDRQVTIAMNLDEKIAGASEREVTATQSTTVQGPWSNQAGSIYSLTVGGHDGGGQLDVQVRGNSVQLTDGHAIIEARETLTIICGESRLVLAPHEITLDSPTIRVAGKSISVTGDGPALKLDDRAEIVAKKLKLYGEASSLELDKEALVKGSMIRLGGNPQPPLPKEEDGESAMEKLSVKLLDELYQPYANKHYELRAEGFRYEGVTGDDGGVQHHVPREARIAKLELWLEEYPEGKRRSYTFQIAKLPPAETVPGQRSRLKNLGYFKGAEAGDEIEPALSLAIEIFQRENALKPTGNADAGTVAAILARHGY